MMLADRLRHALEQGHRASPVLLIGDSHDPDQAPGDAIVPAAVLIPVTDRADPGVILTLRPATMRRHAGQVAFPGAGSIPRTTARSAPRCARPRRRSPYRAGW